MKPEITIRQGNNGNWFVRKNRVLEAGFINYDDAVFYAMVKYEWQDKKRN